MAIYAQTDTVFEAVIIEPRQQITPSKTLWLLDTSKTAGNFCDKSRIIKKLIYKYR